MYRTMGTEHTLQHVLYGYHISAAAIYYMYMYVHVCIDTRNSTFCPLPWLLPLFSISPPFSFFLSPLPPPPFPYRWMS